MPNHVTNMLRVSGDPKNIREMFEDKAVQIRAKSGR